ncbi:hypothetical protein ACOSQ4_012773 [Xanthoceras sorbifolium]
MKISHLHDPKFFVFHNREIVGRNIISILLEVESMCVRFHRRDKKKTFLQDIYFFSGIMPMTKSLNESHLNDVDAHCYLSSLNYHLFRVACFVLLWTNQTLLLSPSTDCSENKERLGT